MCNKKTGSEGILGWISDFHLLSLSQTHGSAISRSFIFSPPFEAKK